MTPEQTMMTMSNRPSERIPGWNVERVNIAAGLKLARDFGYDSPTHQMVAEYALQRYGRGEEAGAQATALHGGIDLTSWYAILAAAIAGMRVEGDRRIMGYTHTGADGTLHDGPGGLFRCEPCEKYAATLSALTEPDQVWLAQKHVAGRHDHLGIFSDTAKARKACQDKANEYFGEKNTPLLNWQGDAGHISASHYQPGEMSFFTVSRFTVDEVLDNS